MDALYRDDNENLHWLMRDSHGVPLLQVTVRLPPRDFDSKLLSVPLLAAFITSCIGYIVILTLVQRALIGPIQTIGRHLYDVRRRGDYSLRLGERRGDELGDLSRDIDALLDHVHSQQQLLQRQATELQALSYQDGLTGLANRRRFDQALADNWALAQRGQTPLALIMCDVDYFKPFNDNYGHQRGDEVLKQVALIIRGAVVRLSDIAARYGGEEFAILLPDTTEAGAQRIAERVRRDLREAAIPHEYSPIGRVLTLSFGIATLVPSETQAQRELVRHADEALYASKAEGRNRITLASELGY
jgi:diguanylate cyclase (GGDEF)-like protein